jgi:NAD+ kinase
VRQIGILSNARYPQTVELAEVIRGVLCEQNVDVLRSTVESEERETSFSAELDMLITLGGDGTMLRAAHLVAAHGTPILGIHVGRLGFLAEVRSAECEDTLRQVLEGEYWLEERAMLRCYSRRRGTTSGPWEALNDVVIGRRGVSHVIQLATYVDEGYLTTYVADGLIVATATGSTAYALSAGGPILPPELRNMLLVPICPHLSLERTIVLAEGAAVRICVESSDEGAVVIDGVRKADIKPGDEVLLTTSPHVTRFVRTYDRRQVYETLMERLQPRKVKKPDDDGR